MVYEEQVVGLHYDRLSAGLVCVSGDIRQLVMMGITVSCEMWVCEDSDTGLGWLSSSLLQLSRSTHDSSSAMRVKL